MPKSTFVAMPQEEHAEMLAALRRARSGYLLALPSLWWCAAGRNPTEIAAVLFGSRSSVVPHGAGLSGGDLGPGARRPGAERPARTHHCAAPHAAPGAAGQAQGTPTGVWVESHALERCHAGPDQSVLTGQTVQLNGSGSSDADGNPLTFSWTLTAQPFYSQAILSNPTLVNPTFVVDQPGTYAVQLIVNDGTDDSLPDTVTITTDGYYIEGSINSKTRFASILGTASLTVMILGLFSRRRHGSTRQRIER